MQKIGENIGRKLVGGCRGCSKRGPGLEKAGGEKGRKKLLFGWRLLRMSDDRLVRKVVALLNDC